MLLDGIEDHPRLFGRALEKVEAVGHIDDLCPLLSGTLCHQPGDDPAHGGIAQDNIITLLRQKPFELPVRPQIVGALR